MTPKKAPRKRGAAAGGPATPKTPKAGKKRAAGTENPDGVTPPKKTRTKATTDTKTSDGVDTIANGADGELDTGAPAEIKTPKAAKIPNPPKTPKTPKSAKDGADGEPKLNGRKRASPNGGEKPAAALSIPLSWDTAEEYDRKLVEMKRDGASWGEINKMWEAVTGRVAKGSTLPNRYIRLMVQYLLHCLLLFKTCMSCPANKT